MGFIIKFWNASFISTWTSTALGIYANEITLCGSWPPKLFLPTEIILTPTFTFGISISFLFFLSLISYYPSDTNNHNMLIDTFVGKTFLWKYNLWMIYFSHNEINNYINIHNTKVSFKFHPGYFLKLSSPFFWLKSIFFKHYC